MTTSVYLQPSGKPVIDVNGNYLVYDLRVNDTMAEYAKQNGLDTVDGQRKFLASGKPIEFPVGFYDDSKTKTGGLIGSVALKTAWKIIDRNSGDDPARYFTIPGQIPVSKEHSETGQDFCIHAELALVGMHIMRRTHSGNGDSWIWSTFEHIDTAPIAENSRRPNDVLSASLFEGGCRAPEILEQQYALYSDKCPDCPTNSLTTTDWKWSQTAPFAGNYLEANGVGSQVVRCWDIFHGTDLINQEWQKKLADTVWANYRSVSAQWKGANRGKTVPEGEVPRFLTNTTMETYEQYAHDGSCLSCHASARTVAGQPTGFSFLLSLITRYID